MKTTLEKLVMCSQERSRLEVRVKELEQALAVAGMSLDGYDASYGGGGGRNEALEIARLLGFDGNSNEAFEFLLARVVATAGTNLLS